MSGCHHCQSLLDPAPPLFRDGLDSFFEDSFTALPDPLPPLLSALPFCLSTTTQLATPFLPQDAAPTSRRFADAESTPLPEPGEATVKVDTRNKGARGELRELDVPDPQDSEKRT